MITTKLEGLEMKIVVHLNHGVDKSYLLVFGKNAISRSEVRELVERNDDSAAKLLMLQSDQRHELTQTEIRRAEFAADFVMNQHGYSSERLA